MLGTSAPPLTAMPIPDASLEAFRVREPAQAMQYLRAVQERSIAVQLSASDGSVLATRLWHIQDSPARLAFAVEMSNPVVNQIAEADEVSAVCFLDQVRIQFDLNHCVLVHGAQQAMLQCDLPTEMLRFQRRSAYRVRTLDKGGPVAHFRHPGIPDMPLALRVLDVSAGGVALLVPDDIPAVEPGVAVSAVRIELDSSTTFTTGLHIHHVTALQPQSGGQRLGCEFLALSPDDARMLQRYIDQTQKRRRMLSLD